MLAALHGYFVCDQSESFSNLSRQALGAAFSLLPLGAKVSWGSCETSSGRTLHTTNRYKRQGLSSFLTYCAYNLLTLSTWSKSNARSSSRSLHNRFRLPTIREDSRKVAVGHALAGFIALHNHWLYRGEVCLLLTRSAKTLLTRQCPPPPPPPESAFTDSNLVLSFSLCKLTKPTYSSGKFFTDAAGTVPSIV